MKRLLAIFSCLLIVLQANSQYYYNDILGTEQANQQYKLFLLNQLKKVTATSFEGNNEPVTDFMLEQQIDVSNQQVVTRSKTIANGESFFTSYYKGNKLQKTADSSSNAINTVTYEYDTQGRIKSITSLNKDFDGKLINNEKHLWQFTNDGIAESMTRVKNGTDTTFVSFKYDEAGNVAEEIWTRNNRTIENYYYYYNDKQKISDIVRYNRRAKQMLPDFIMEYDAQGRITQMTQTQSGNANYLIWKYQYNDQGLKDKEYVFNKQKELLGKIEYSYQ